MADAFWTQMLDMIQYTDYVAKFADPARTIVDIEPYSYTVDDDANVSNITQTASRSFRTTMAGDNDFLMTAIAGMARVAGQVLLLVNPAVLVQIQDNSTGRTFFSAPTPMPFMAGQMGFPFLLPGPKMLKARTSLTTTVISAQTVQYNGFYLAFHGARIWYA